MKDINKRLKDLEELIDRVETESSEEYSDEVDGLWRAIGNFYDRLEEQENDKKRQRDAALNKVTSGIIDYINTYENIPHIEPNDEIVELTKISAEAAMKEVAEQAKQLLRPKEAEKQETDAIKKYINDLLGGSR